MAQITHDAFLAGMRQATVHQIPNPIYTFLTASPKLCLALLHRKLSRFVTRAQVSIELHCNVSRFKETDR